MTFSINVPNAAQSPGLFPTQANANFSRLKTLINVDHNFTNTSQQTQGMHRNMSMINRSAIQTPANLPVGADGLVYTALDPLNESQLFYLNSVSNQQITPGLSVIARGTYVLTTARNASPIFTFPANSFGFLYMWTNSTVTNRNFADMIWKSNGVIVNAYGKASYTGFVVDSSFISIVAPNTPGNLDLYPVAVATSVSGTYNFKILQIS